MSDFPKQYAFLKNIDQNLKWKKVHSSGVVRLTKKIEKNLGR